MGDRRGRRRCAAGAGRREAVSLAWLALAVTAIAFLLWYGAVGRIGAERAGLLAGLLPVSAALVAAIVDGAVPDPWRLVGVLAVGLGISVGLSGARAPRPAPPELVP